MPSHSHTWKAKGKARAIFPRDEGPGGREGKVLEMGVTGSGVYDMYVCPLSSVYLPSLRSQTMLKFCATVGSSPEDHSEQLACEPGLRELCARVGAPSKVQEHGLCCMHDGLRRPWLDAAIAAATPPTTIVELVKVFCQASAEASPSLSQLIDIPHPLFL